ncbi:MAG: PilZ domain-containing protein [Fibrobacteria bacterium]|nr:PilZ domain-containing protein [Fibrobacteria bacterium]
MDKQKKIVIINRIKFLRAITKRSLNLLGFENIVEKDTLSSGSSANFYRDNPVVILEFPDINEFSSEMESLAGLRQGPHTKHLIIIATLSAVEVKKDFVLKVVSKGIKDLILKTNDINALADRLRKALEKTLRKFKRTRFSEPLKVLNPENDELSGMMQDITIGGFLLTGEAQMQKDKVYPFKIELPAEINGLKEISQEAVCRWCKEDPVTKFKAGFQIQKLDETNKVVIEVLVKDYCTVDVET